MQCPVEGEPDLDVPFEPVDGFAVNGEVARALEFVADFDGEGVPVARRCFRIWSVGPVLGDDAPVVGFGNEILFVRSVGDGVGLAASGLVGAKFDVAQ